MSGPGGAAGGAPRSRPGALEVAIEAAALLTALFVATSIVLRGRPLAGAVSAWRPLLPLALLALFGLLAWRSRRAVASPAATPGLAPGRWLAGLGPPGLVLAAVLLCVLAALPPPSGTLGADGQAYLEQLRGVLLEGRLGTHPGVEAGATVLWAPFYFVGHAVARFAALAGLDVPADGTSEPYRSALHLGAVAYALLAAAFAQRAAARFVSPLLAAVCAAGLWLGSSLFHYTVAEPAMAHAPAAAVSSLLLLFWLRAREAPERAGRWIAVGLVGGLLVAVQRYDVYLLLPAVLSAAVILRGRWATGDTLVRRRTAFAVAATLLAFAVSVLPLVVLTLASPSRFLLDPEIARSRMLADWARPHVLPLLFASNGGFFAWTPLAVPAVLGLVLLARRDRRVGLALLATLALGVYVLASNPTWWAGFSFGARRLTEAYPILVVGLAVLGAALLRRPWVLGVAGLALFAGQGVLFSAQMRKGRVEPGDAMSFLAVAQGALADVHDALGHPGSWPASWAFAWKHGVSPGRFDELYGRVPRDRWVVRVGTPEDAAVLGRGWSRPAEPGGRWAQQDEATLLVTLVGPADRSLRLRGAAARHPGGREQDVAVEVNGSPAGRLRLDAAGRSWEVLVPASSWREGLNEVRFRAAWRLSRQEAWAAGEPPFVGFRLDEVAVEPVR
jgi:hypothetical protein